VSSEKSGLRRERSSGEKKGFHDVRWNRCYERDSIYHI
jgi:hypothetical protein